MLVILDFFLILIFLSVDKFWPVPKPPHLKGQSGLGDADIQVCGLDIL